MQKNILWGLLVATAGLSPSVYAVGLGNHQVQSALGQPLKVAIDVVSSTKGAISASCFSVGTSKEIINGENIPVVTQGTLSVENKGKGKHRQTRLIFTSLRPVNDPVVRLAIETSCGQRARREFTLMLDPQSANDGKDIPLPLAPTSNAPKTTETSLESATPIVPAVVPSNPTHKVVSPVAIGAAKTGTDTIVPRTAMEDIPTVDANAGKLSPEELARLEKAIKSSPDKKGRDEKKKPTENRVTQESALLSPPSIPDDAGDGGEPRLLISGASKNRVVHDKDIEPKLSLTTELSTLHTPSAGSGSTGVMDAKERADILARVDSIVNAPLEHDLSAEQKNKLNHKVADEMSSYERVVRQRTEQKLKEQVLLEQGAKSERNLYIALLLGGSALLLLGYWGFRTYQETRNPSRRRGKRAPIKVHTPNTPPPTFTASAFDAEEETTAAINTDQTPTIAKATQKDSIIEKHTATTAPLASLSTADSNTAPTEALAPSPAEESAQQANAKHQEVTSTNVDATEPPVENALPSTLTNEPIENTEVQPSPVFISAFNDVNEKPLIDELPPIFAETTYDGAALDMPPITLEPSASHTQETSTAHYSTGHTLFQPKIVVNSSFGNPEQPFNLTKNNIEQAPSPENNDTENTLNQAEDALKQGQTIVDQATQYVHAEKSDLALSYLESSIEWFPSAPQPWLLLLKLCADQELLLERFHLHRDRFLSQYKNIKTFSKEEFLVHTPQTQEPSHQAAIEQCSPALLNDITHHWNDIQLRKNVIIKALTHDIKNEVSIDTSPIFTVMAVQELLFLYNLISTKTP